MQISQINSADYSDIAWWFFLHIASTTFVEHCNYRMHTDHDKSDQICMLHDLNVLQILKGNVVRLSNL